MCGIAGIVGRLCDANRAALKRMSDAMIHRGPDGEGFWEASPDSRGWGALLAHRRLSILDLSPNAAQPMVDPLTGDVVVFNGEIYNYAELREQLVCKGHEFRSTGDTAVMLRMLGVHGRRAVGSLRGMFAFAFWDSGERRLMLARDPLGIKPLYLLRNSDSGGEWSLAFASEVRALLASGLLGKPRLNPRAVASVVWNGFVVSPDTAIAGIEGLWPGQLRVYGPAGSEESAQHYWSVAPRSAEGPMDIARLEREVQECVRLHLASDVPLGVFLSGGVDSAAVANLAQKASEGNVHTFTLAFEEQQYNEGPVARRIAGAIGTRHREVVLTEGAFVAQLDSALDSLDQPTFDGLNSYYMSRAVRDAGFKVALVGTGGDELFGGYRSFRDLPMLLELSRRTAWIPESARVAAARLVGTLMQGRGRAVPQQTRWAKLREMVRDGRDLLSLYQLAYALFLPEFQQQLKGEAIEPDLADGLPAEMRSRLDLETRARSPLSAISVMELRLFLGERLLRDADSTSMAASIEMRLPLVDHVLFDSVDSLSDGERYHPLGKKSLLRRIGLRGLDPMLFARPKSGFVLPFDRWLKAGLGKAMDATLRDSAAASAAGLNPDLVRRLWQAFLDGSPGLYWSRVWAIYVLVRWCQRHRLSV